MRNVYRYAIRSHTLNTFEHVKNISCLKCVVAHKTLVKYKQRTYTCTSDIVLLLFQSLVRLQAVLRVHDDRDAERL